LSESPYTYQFGPVFQSDDGKTVAIGKVGLDGNMNARIIKKVFGDAVDLKANVNSCLSQPERNMAELACDMNFANVATSAKVVYQGIWILNGGFSQKVTKDLYLGGELTYLAFQGGQSMATMGARYQLSPEQVIACSLGRQPDFKNPGRQTPIHNYRMQYTRKVSDRVNLGTEFEYSFPDHDSSLKAGYEYNFKTGRVQGAVDTSGRINCAVQDHKSGFGFSGMIDYLRNDYKFGMMIQYFPMPEGQGEPQPAPF